jgi:hypothetical protein
MSAGFGVDWMLITISAPRTPRIGKILAHLLYHHQDTPTIMHPAGSTMSYQADPVTEAPQKSNLQRPSDQHIPIIA